MVNLAGQVLLIERTVDGVHEVRLPKGHIQPDETPEAAACREVCEETGYCDLQILADLGWRTVSFEQPTAHVVREERYYLIILASERHSLPRFSSQREALFRNRWTAGFAEAESLLTFEAEKDAARRAQAVYLALR